ncbi:MAG: hypothetical protein IT480_07325 [Gammaproteobacteria bacterium]|nr:hypothetical protein [Gammaproteobacteria bacterium]
MAAAAALIGCGTRDEVMRVALKAADIAEINNVWQGANVCKYYGETVGEPFTTGAFVRHPVTRPAA